MKVTLSTAGAASPALRYLMHCWWSDAAKKSGVDLTGFNPDAPLEERLRWAREKGLDIAGAIARYSSKLQHSTESQLEAAVEWGAKYSMYVCPDYACVDEATKGRKQRRDGLDRMTVVPSFLLGASGSARR